MKRILCVLTLFAAFLANAQENDSIPFELTKQSYIYGMAKKYNDPAVARMAIYNLLAYNPLSVQLIDTLAYMFYQYQQFASAAISAQDAIALDPNDLFATEIAALSFEKLGIKNRAVSYYEKLYLAENDLPTLYQVAFLQYELKRYGEASTNADVIIADARSEKQMLLFPTADNRGQEIGMKVAVYRLKSLIELDKGNKEGAKEWLNKAIQLAPNFEVGKTELAELNKG
jgi:tetratricopeptide (TPR) repeat protein